MFDRFDRVGISPLEIEMDPVAGQISQQGHNTGLRNNLNALALALALALIVGVGVGVGALKPFSPAVNTTKATKVFTETGYTSNTYYYQIRYMLERTTIDNPDSIWSDSNDVLFLDDEWSSLEKEACPEDDIKQCDYTYHLNVCRLTSDDDNAKSDIDKMEWTINTIVDLSSPAQMQCGYTVMIHEGSATNYNGFTHQDMNYYEHHGIKKTINKHEGKESCNFEDKDVSVSRPEQCGTSSTMYVGGSRRNAILKTGLSYFQAEMSKDVDVHKYLSHSYSEKFAVNMTVELTGVNKTELN